MKILDSDHCIAILRGQVNLEGHLSPAEELAITSINAAELIHGAYKSNRPQENLTRLDIFLSQVQILPFDESAARQFGWLKTETQRAGQPLSDLDLQIASIALSVNCPLLTHNRVHFERLTQFSPLQIEDWLI